MSEKTEKTDGKAFLKAPPKIMACKCKHEYQDQKYGKGMRVQNPCKEGRFRCTVCGNKT